ncbi:hypothetical protein ACFY8P_25360 [Streptomyces sp. NPDC012693]|uniref:hypothetical protein n=1 Tax=Streptomyces sp. NPDC012693 TaxID=3364844 RepID=UPI00369D70DB
MSATPPPRRSRRHQALRGPAALTALLAGAAAATLAGAPAEASAARAVRVPMHQCWVNGVSAPPGEIVSGTNGDDHIFCDSDLENVTVWGGYGNDMIEVRGLVIDSAVMGGEGDDVIRAKHLVPQNASSMVRGNRGNDIIKVATVAGDGATRGAVVHGDDGDDRITTGSVTGPPGRFNRGGGIVTGNDGIDTIKVGTIDFSGRVLGGSEADVIEAAALGPESGGLIQAGPGDDRISGPDGAVLTVGPHWGSVDAGVGKDTCVVKSVSTRTSVSSCEELTKTPLTDGTGKPAKPTGPSAGHPTKPAHPADTAAGQAVKPAHPADTAAGNAVKPADPSPEQPVKPADPSAGRPAKPESPSDPADPSAGRPTKPQDQDPSAGRLTKPVNPTAARPAQPASRPKPADTAVQHPAKPADTAAGNAAGPAGR